jgi:putative ABC transport system ATP-binding protein
MNIIEFRDVHKVYSQGRREVRALNGLSVTVEQGEFVAVVGPSGSGKSTFLHLAGGLDLPTSGEVIVNGQVTSSLSDLELTRLRRQHIGFVFQAFNLVPTLTAMENTALPALLTGGRFAEVRPKAEAMLERVGLLDRVTHSPEELSGGELQRVAIARALINSPPLLLADEPTGNLDSVNGFEILNLLREIGSGRTLVIITHDPKVASVAPRLIQIKDGRLQ